MKSLICLVMIFTFAGVSAQAKKSKKRSVASARTYSNICKELHAGAHNRTSLIESCIHDMGEFVQKQTNTRMAELAKKSLSSNSKLKAKIIGEATDIFNRAKAKKVLVTKGGRKPKLFLGDYVGDGITCVQNYTKDYDSELIPGEYYCSADTDIYIKYKNSKCEGFGFNKSTEELNIHFVIKEDGTILEDSITSRSLVVTTQCAA